MITILSVLTSVKDYIEIVHKLVESDQNLDSYQELGSILVYVLISLKEFIINFLTFSWLKNIWSLPIVVPDVASAMVSEISVLDGFFHNAFNILENPLFYSQNNLGIYASEKFLIGFLNSFFLFLPTSAAHIITLRRFVMQGVEVGFLAGLGTIAGNILWIASIIFGWRFFVIPWLSFDVFRYLLGFCLLAKYIWDTTKERRMFFQDFQQNTERIKIILLNFLLALTEQTSIYPFITNMSFGAEGSILETFPVETYTEFLVIHGAYIFGILIGSLSLLYLTCWFWENPAFSFYMWLISSYSKTKVGGFITDNYYKVLKFSFTYLTMLCAICSIPYFGLDYTLTNPLGLIPQDRLIDQQKSSLSIPELSFLGVQPTDKNNPINSDRLISPDRHRWHKPIQKYLGFDTSVYGRGNYEFLTVEDLNYGFDRSWGRRKLREHKFGFRIKKVAEFLKLREAKKQMIPASSKLLGTGSPAEFYRMLSEHFYHPSFHTKNNPKELLETRRALFPKALATPTGTEPSNKLLYGTISESKVGPLSGTPLGGLEDSIVSASPGYIQNSALKAEFSTLRKFVRNLNTRFKTGKIAYASFWESNTPNVQNGSLEQTLKPIYSKRWKHLYSQSERSFTRTSSLAAIASFKDKNMLSYMKTTRSMNDANLLRGFSRYARKILLKKVPKVTLFGPNRKTWQNYSAENKSLNDLYSESLKKTTLRKKLSKKEKQILRYRTFLSLNGTTAQPYGPNNVISFSSSAPFASSKDNKEGAAVEQGKVANANLGVGGAEQTATQFPREFLAPRQKRDSAGDQKQPIQSGLATELKAQSMVHPLKYYLQKEQAYRQKLNYYGSYVGSRSLTLNNNAPYLRCILKRGFYYYKPTLRWEKTMSLAKNKDQKQKRKTKKFRTQRKLINTLPLTRSENPQSGAGLAATVANTSFSAASTLGDERVEGGIPAEQVYLTKPTHSYSSYGKRVYRYRNQIYKDVLQHWYYTPWNRLLLRFDIDAFMSRQPRSHFLTKKEEQLLHLRRLLLSEHYDTLRWYTYMQHYRTMKSRIGPTKSFSSRVYNQQFQGTFKKIRHLFAITPSQEQLILKFDQPLYNEFPNNSIKSIVDSSVIHEELNTIRPVEEDAYLFPEGRDVNLTLGVTGAGMSSTLQAESPSQDLISQSSNIVRQYLSESTPLREEKIKAFLNEKNYWQLTDFLWKGQKTVGTQPITNQKDLLSFIDQTVSFSELNDSTNPSQKDETGPKTVGTRESKIRLTPFIKTENWVKLFKESQRRLYARKFSQKYNQNRSISDIKRGDKLKKSVLDAKGLAPRQKKEFKQRLENLKLWLINAKSPAINYSNTKSMRNEIEDNRTETRGIAARGIAASPTYNNLKNSMRNAINDSIVALYGKNTLRTNKPLLKFKLKALKSNLEQRFMQNSYNATHLQKSPFSLDRDGNWKEVQESSLALKQQTLSSLLASRSLTLDLATKTSSAPNVLSRPEQPQNQTFLNNQLNLRNSSDLKQKISTRLVWWKKTLKKGFVRFGNKLKTIPPTKYFTRKSIKNVHDWVKKKRRIKDRRNSSRKLDKKFFTSEDDLISENQPYASLMGLGNRAKKDGESTDFNLIEQKIRNSIFSRQGKFKHKATAKLGRFNRFVSASQRDRQNLSVSALELRDVLNGPKGDAIKQEKFDRPTKRFSTLKKPSRLLLQKKRETEMFKQQKYPSNQDVALFDSKIQSLNRKLKRIKVNYQIQKWWWNSYLPNLQESQKQTLMQSKQYLKYETGLQQTLNTGKLDLSTDFLQIGDRDFKPLAFPQAAQIRENLNKKSETQIETPVLQSAQKNAQATVSPFPEGRQTFEGIEKVYENLFLNKTKSVETNSKMLSLVTQPTNPMPFYAGWDESKRKLVVTTRYLSRREAGLEMKNLNQYSNLKQLVPTNMPNSVEFTKLPLKGMTLGSFYEFGKGLSFLVYNQLQFSPFIQDPTFYAPIGWKRFEFRHSVLKNWLASYPKKESHSVRSVPGHKVEGMASHLLLGQEQESNLSNSLILQGPVLHYTTSLKQKDENILEIWSKFEKIKNQKNRHSYIEKNHKLIASDTNGYYIPTGPLLTHVLPAHYLNVFQNKPSRKSSSRYLKRRPSKNSPISSSVIEYNQYLNSFNVSSSASYNSSTNIPDFTLRKRIKPKRKYYSRVSKIRKDGSILPRRGRFMANFDRNALLAKGTNNFISFPTSSQGYETMRPDNSGPKDDNQFFVSSEKAPSIKQSLIGESKVGERNDYGRGFRWRPLGKSKKPKNPLEQKKPRRTLAARKFRREKRYPRELRQVFKPAFRSEPRYGGLMWPGEYLQLEVTPYPKKIKLETVKSENKIKRKLEEKTKSLTPYPLLVQISPRKYLIQTHNLKVLKKKLQKAQRSNKLAMRIQELNNILAVEG